MSLVLFAASAILLLEILDEVVAYLLQLAKFIFVLVFT